MESERSDAQLSVERERDGRAGHTKFGSPPLLAQYDPDFVFSCYEIHKTPTPPALNCDTRFWTARGYELVTMHIPGLLERGEYYTFRAKKTRNFDEMPSF